MKKREALILIPVILLFLFGVVLNVFIFTQTVNKLNPGYLISSKSFYGFHENNKDSQKTGNKIITVKLESGTDANRISIAEINLLLDRVLDNICNQIKETQEEPSGNDSKIQQSQPSGSGTSSINSAAVNNQSENLEVQMLITINNLRKENGLQMLKLNQTLKNIAYSRSQDMIDRSYFSHNTPEGKSIFNILVESEVMYAYAGENLYNCTPPSMGPPEAIISTWLGSENHRANIFNPNYSQVGIKIVDGGNRRVATAIFLN